MNCSNCSTPLAASARFCPNCGQPAPTPGGIHISNSQGVVIGANNTVNIHNAPGAPHAAAAAAVPSAAAPAAVSGAAVPGAAAAPIRILYLAANPTDVRLRLDQEVRSIQEKLQLARLRERFEIAVRLAVRPDDLIQALLDLEPRIVHFSGHGTADGSLVLENAQGASLPAAPETLAALFQLVSQQVECVLLNACYSEAQAKAIARHIPYVIGMNQEVSDKAALSFSAGFYQALGAGRSLEDAYHFGVVQIRLQGLPEHLTPVLLRQAP